MNEILFGDCRDSLRKMAADGVKAQMCVTSPPYFGLRDYGTATWEGGDAACDHRPARLKEGRNEDRQTFGGSFATHGSQLLAFGKRTTCDKCGATKTDQQIGLEETPDQFIAELVGVFRCVRDVLTDDGVLFVNIGDSYAANRGRQVPSTLMNGDTTNQAQAGSGRGMNAADIGLKQKDLIGIPWMLAFALRADGWYLRQDIIWHKPNPMPESVTDRCTKSHEYIFLLSKSPRYFYDAEAVKEPAVCGAHPPGNTSHRGATAYAAGDEKHRTKAGLASYAARVRESRERGSFNGKTESMEGRNAFRAVVDMRNRRSVWTVATKPYKGAHFATFPEALITPCILAGSRPGDIVLDPFMGSGTTAAVAIAHGRQYVGCELNADYKPLQDERIAAARSALLAPAKVRKLAAKISTYRQLDIFEAAA